MFLHLHGSHIGLDARRSRMVAMKLSGTQGHGHFAAASTQAYPCSGQNMQRILVLCAFCLCILRCDAARAQGQTPPASVPRRSAPSSSSAPSNSYTLDISSSLVIEDISVADKHGNPVTGLPANAFHIQDDGIAQSIRDFSEHSGSLAAVRPESDRYTYTNAWLYRNGGSVVAMLIDPVSMALPDQMFLRLQMLKYLNALPEGTPVAIFRANSRGIPVLIQSITSDRGRLIAAVNASVPAISRPADSFSNAIAELANISDYLRPVPGKKVLLWFAGRFPLYLDPDLCSVMGSMTPTIDSNLTYPDCGSLNEVRKDAFRALQQARIAVYPIDVRGVVILGPPPVPGMSTSISNSPGSIAAPVMGEISRINGQYDDMEQLATATGGHAYYSDNALAQAMASAVDLGEHTYTVAYRPEPYKTDGRWHKVRITVDGSYTVRYRTGYYAAEATPPPRPLLQASGTVVAPEKQAGSTQTPSLSQGSPIVFSAHLQPQGKAGKSSRYLIEYEIPSRELVFSAGANETQHARFRLAVLAYNSEGDVLSDAIDTVETSYTAAQMQTANRIGTPASQTIDAAKGSGFLLLAVQDLQTQRVGTLQIPLNTVGQSGTPIR